MTVIRTAQETKARRVYAAGIWDLFHRGHVLQLQELKTLDGQENHVIIGVLGDKEATAYKREPIINESDRAMMIESCKFVDQVIEHIPIKVDEQFMDKYQIDLVVHGYQDAADAQKQRDFYAIPDSLGKFRKIPYHEGISTTQIMSRINERHHAPNNCCVL